MSNTPSDTATHPRMCRCTHSPCPAACGRLLAAHCARRAGSTPTRPQCSAYRSDASRSAAPTARTVPAASAPAPRLRCSDSASHSCCAPSRCATPDSAGSGSYNDPLLCSLISIDLIPPSPRRNLELVYIEIKAIKREDILLTLCHFVLQVFPLEFMKR